MKKMSRLLAAGLSALMIFGAALPASAAEQKQPAKSASQAKKAEAKKPAMTAAQKEKAKAIKEFDAKAMKAANAFAKEAKKFEKLGQDIQSGNVTPAEYKKQAAALGVAMEKLLAEIESIPAAPAAKEYKADTLNILRLSLEMVQMSGEIIGDDGSVSESFDEQAFTDKVSNLLKETMAFAKKYKAYIDPNKSAASAASA